MEMQSFCFSTIRPLPQKRRRALEAQHTSRWESVTPHSLNCCYGSGGDLGGSRIEYLREDFDLLVECALWGTRRIMLRLPATVEPICAPYVVESDGEDRAGIRWTPLPTDEGILEIHLEAGAEDDLTNEIWGIYRDNQDQVMNDAGRSIAASLLDSDPGSLVLAWLGFGRLGYLAGQALPIPPSATAPSEALNVFFGVTTTRWKAAIKAAAAGPVDPVTLLKI